MIARYIWTRHHNSHKIYQVCMTDLWCVRMTNSVDLIWVYTVCSNLLVRMSILRKDGSTILAHQSPMLRGELLRYSVVGVGVNIF